MKVITPGDPSRRLPCLVRCEHCQAVLQVAQTDCYTRSFSGKRGRHSRVYFTCPSCRNEQCPEALQGIAALCPTWQEFNHVPDWRHTKGGVYNILALAQGQQSTVPEGGAAKQIEGFEFVVYRSTLTGKVYVRLAGEFYDGRFQQVPGPTSTDPPDSEDAGERAETRANADPEASTPDDPWPPIPIAGDWACASCRWHGPKPETCNCPKCKSEDVFPTDDGGWDKKPDESPSWDEDD